MIKSKFIQNINLENLIFISNELKEFNPFVYFGTLLGLTRENNILKDDDDIDLCLNSKFRENVIKKLNNLNNFKIIDWGEISDSDMIINATSIGLNNEDKMPFKFSDFGKNKFFYDIIYNPSETDFLKKAKNLGNRIENGKKMFIYQAAAAFKIWHKIEPEISEKITKILD